MARIDTVGKAWKERRARKVGNHRTDGTTYWLFGNPIARYTDAGTVEVQTAGYNSMTTRSTLSMLGYSVGLVYTDVKPKGRMLILCGSDMKWRIWKEHRTWTPVDAAGELADPELPPGYTYIPRITQLSLLVRAGVEHLVTEAANPKTQWRYRRVVAAPEWARLVLLEKASPAKRVRALRAAQSNEQQRLAYLATHRLGCASIDVLL